MLLGACLTALCQLPARWLTHWVSAATQQHLHLLDASGTVWNGSARLGLSGGQGSQDSSVLAGRVHWQLSLTRWPDSLRPAFQLDVSQDCCMPLPLRVLIGPGWGQSTVQLQSAELQLPASLLQGLGAPWNTLALQGYLSLNSSPWTITLKSDQIELAGQARIRLQSLRSPVSTLQPIGNYQIDVEAGKTQGHQPVRFKLQTLNGALELSGAGELGPQGWRFKGEAGAQPQYKPALTNLLNLISSRSGPIIISIRP